MVKGNPPKVSTIGSCMTQGEQEFNSESSYFKFESLLGREVNFVEAMRRLFETRQVRKLDSTSLGALLEDGLGMCPNKTTVSCSNLPNP